MRDYDTEIEQREIAVIAARYYRHQGVSAEDFVELVEYLGITPAVWSDALWALHDRDELEHLVAYMWHT